MISGGVGYLEHGHRDVAGEWYLRQGVLLSLAFGTSHQSSKTTPILPLKALIWKSISQSYALLAAPGILYCECRDLHFPWRYWMFYEWDLQQKDIPSFLPKLQ